MSLQRRERRRLKRARPSKTVPFPIRNVADLKNAIQAFGRAKNKAKVKRHIIKRARALGKVSLLPESWGITAAAGNELRERLAEFSTVESADEKKIRQLLQDRGAAIPDTPEEKAVKAEDAKEAEAKYTPKTQPRDYNGQFRTVLARIKEDLGVSGNQAVVEKLQATEQFENTGDYAGAVKSALDLKNDIDRLDDGALNADSIGNLRETVKDLSTTLAKLPLPFKNQAAKVRFSDLPPTLRDLIDDFITRVEDKIGTEDAESAVADMKSFKSGSDVFSQAEISSQMNKLLRLLT
jgi:hypothetical protein